MTFEESITLLEAARKTIYLPKSKGYISDLGYALEMAIRSLEAWEKVKEEIKQKQELAWGLYNDGLQDALNSIDKHLSEVSE